MRAALIFLSATVQISKSITAPVRCDEIQLQTDSL